jgi:hypothetical protein
VPSARFEVLDGQTHMVKPKALVPVAAAFLGRDPVSGDL